MVLKRNDRHDVDRHELLLIRSGQHLVLESRRKGYTVKEREAFWEAAAIIWEAKRKYRLELAAKRKAKGEAFAARIRGEHSGFRAGK